MNNEGKVTVISEREILDELRVFVSAAGSQKAAAAHLNVTPQFLCDVLKGNRNLSDVIANGLGYKSVRVFIKEDTKR